MAATALGVKRVEGAVAALSRNVVHAFVDTFGKGFDAIFVSPFRNYTYVILAWDCDTHLDFHIRAGVVILLRWQCGDAPELWLRADIDHWGSMRPGPP